MQQWVLGLIQGLPRSKGPRREHTDMFLRCCVRERHHQSTSPCWVNVCTSPIVCERYVFLQTNITFVKAGFDEIKKLGILGVFFCSPSVFAPLLIVCNVVGASVYKGLRALVNWQCLSLDRQSGFRRWAQVMLETDCLGSAVKLRKLVQECYDGTSPTVKRICR